MKGMGRMKQVSWLLFAALALLPTGWCARAQTAELESAYVDEATRLLIETRLNQFMDDMGRISEGCTAKLPVSNDIQFVDGYIRMVDYRLHNLELNLNAFDVRWNVYYPTMQFEISQDEGLMTRVERIELMKQEAADSLEVRKQMLQSLRDFSEAMSYMESLDTTYNGIGKRAFQYSLTSQTAAQLEKQKKKEELIFATVQEKFDKAKEAQRLHMVSDENMAELEDLYTGLKHKSETIQEMAYKPLIQRIKDYLLGLAAVAVLLLFANMVQAKIKAARDLRKNMKQYEETLKQNGEDNYPTL